MAHQRVDAYVLTLVLALFLSLTMSPRAEAQGRPPRPGPQCVTGCLGTISVTPDGANLSTNANTNGNNASFGLVFSSSTTTARTFTLTCSRSGGVTCGTITPSSVTLQGPNDDAMVTVGYNVSGTGGTLTLRASYGTGSIQDNGFYNIQVRGAPVVALRNHNRDNVDRSLCLTAGAGEAAAWGCGDLVIAHSMPGFSTVGRERAPTLVYNSGTAYPRPAVAAVVTQPSGRAQPTAVFAELQVSGVVRTSATYTPWPSGAGGSRQVVLDYNAALDSTGAYPIRLRIQNQYTGFASHDTFVDDTALVVNRFFGKLGAGFGLAGLEQLYFNQPVGTALDHILWVGGDGSAKLFRKVDSTTWAAAAGAYRDTLTLSGGIYARKLRHGIQVRFNSSGRHIETINRAGLVTKFHWNGAILDSITVPPALQSGTRYKVAWAADSTLNFIEDPAGRKLDATISVGRLSELIDPDGKKTEFGWDADRRIVWRKNRRGYTTSYEYSNGLAYGSRVTRVTIPTERPGQTPTTAITRFEPWNDKGLAVGASNQTAIDTALAYTRVLGPRYPSVADTAAFWVDRWGAPTRIGTAVPATTRLTREDANVPALVTQVVYANNRIVRMSYDARGNLTSVRDSTYHLDLRPTQATTYIYPTSGAALDSPIQVNDSIGTQARTTAYKYNNLGLTDTVIAPNGHRTSFAYTTGAIAGLIDSTMERGVETWRETVSDDVTDTQLDQVHRFTYDGKGNLKTYNSPVGVVTSYVADSLGRITDVYDPLQTREERSYDAMNRVLELRRYTDSVAHPGGVNPLGIHSAQGRPCDATQVLCVDSTVAFNPTLLPNPHVTRYGYNANGALDTIIDPRGMRRTFSHDARELQWQATDDYGQSQTATFSPSGAPDFTISRRGIRVNSYYDAAGRHTSMAYPAVPSPDPSFAPATIAGDSIRYTYDVMGNVTKVRSNADSIMREYYADGSLKRKISSVGPDTQSDTVSYEYDVTDAVTRVVHGQDTTDYGYNATTSVLLTMTVRWGGRTDGPRVFSFLWDQLGRRRQITYPTDPSGASNMTVKFRYDGAGILRRVTSDHPGAPGGNALLDAFDFKFRHKSVDAAGRIWQQEVTCGGSQALVNACGAGVGFKEVRNQYNRFGMLTRQETVGTSPETMRYDGSGNLIYRARFDAAAAADRQDSFVIDSSGTGVHNQLKRMTEATNIETPLNILYNPDGSRRWETPDAFLDYRETYYYYDGLGRMAGTVERDDDQLNTLHHNPGSCIYDPEGQLVVACDGTGVYLSFTGRNVSGVLYNPQGSGWRFVHGPNTDDPLTGYHRLTGTDRILYYVTDGQGRVLALADSSGFRSSEYDNNSSIARWRLAGGAENAQSFNADRMSGGDVPKLSFYRNRAYDQTTGRWTQEDPIGVAGGLNLYQFNGNNPVTFSDPFGLCPENSTACAVYKAGMQVLGFLSGAIDGAIRGGAIGGLGGPEGVLIGAVAGGLIEGVAVAQLAGIAAEASWSANGPAQMADAGKGRAGNRVPNSVADRIAKENNLNPAGRRQLHDAISKKGLDADEIADEAAEIAKQKKWVTGD